MLRAATEKDLAALARLEAEWSSEPWSEEGFLAFFGEECSLILVAEEDGAPVGYATARFAADYGELLNLAVAGGHRRRGIGAALLRALLLFAKERGVENVTLEVRTSNAAARALYEAMGFVPCALRRNFYRNPTEDAVVYTHSERTDEH